MDGRQPYLPIPILVQLMPTCSILVGAQSTRLNVMPVGLVSPFAVWYT